MGTASEAHEIVGASEPHEVLRRSASEPHEILSRSASKPHEILLGISTESHEILLGIPTESHEVLLWIPAKPHEVLFRIPTKPHEVLLGISAIPIHGCSLGHALQFIGSSIAALRWQLLRLPLAEVHEVVLHGPSLGLQLGIVLVARFPAVFLEVQHHGVLRVVDANHRDGVPELQLRPLGLIVAEQCIYQVIILRWTHLGVSVLQRVARIVGRIDDLAVDGRLHLVQGQQEHQGNAHLQG